MICILNNSNSYNSFFESQNQKGFSQMDSQNLRTFIKLAETKNFTRAASQLYVAQSTITNRIAQLESETGKQLVARGRKSISLTEEGEIFLNYARRIVSLEDAALSELNISEKKRLPIRIGTANTYYECYLFPFLKDFLPGQHEYSISITTGLTLHLLQLLQDDLLDLTFTYTPLQRADFVSRLESTEELVLVTSPKNNAYKNGIRKEDLGRLYYVFCNFALQDVGIFIRELFPPMYQFAFEIDNSTKVVDYLLDGIGASFLPMNLVKSYLDEGILESIPLLDFDAPKISNYVSYRKSNEAAMQFLKLYREK